MELLASNSSQELNTSAGIPKFEVVCNESLPLNGTNDCNETNNRTGVSNGNIVVGLLHVIELVFSLCDITCVISNVLVVVVIYKASKFKEAPARLLTNHSISDCGVGLSYLILNGILYTVSDVGVIQTAMLVHRMILFIFLAESMQTLAMSLFFLHLAICNPFHYRLYSKTKYVVLFVVLSWLLNIATWMPILLIDGLFVFEEVAGVQLPMFNVSEANAWFVVFVSTIGYIVPIAVLLVSFIRIKTMMTALQNSNIGPQSTTQSHVQKAKGIMLVSTIFVVTFMPLFIIEILGNTMIIELSGDSLAIILVIFAALGFGYIAFKFPLFLVAFKSYRQVVRDWCCCKCRSMTPKNPKLRTSTTPTLQEQMNEVSDRSRTVGCHGSTNARYVESEGQGYTNDGYAEWESQGQTNDERAEYEGQGHIGDEHAESEGQVYTIDTNTDDSATRQNNSPRLRDTNGNTGISCHGDEDNRV